MNQSGQSSKNIFESCPKCTILMDKSGRSSKIVLNHVQYGRSWWAKVDGPQRRILIFKFVHFRRRSFFSHLDLKPILTVHFWVFVKVNDPIGIDQILNLDERKKFCDLKKHSFFKAFQNKSPSSESPLISPQSSICSIETIGLIFVGFFLAHFQFPAYWHMPFWSDLWNFR